MLKILSLLILFAVVKSHQGKIQNEGDAQSALMPQELNPAFISDKDSPWRAVIPIRHRRDVEPEGTLCKLKTYSRITACIAIALSAIVEVTVYFIELYSVEMTHFETQDDTNATSTPMPQYVN